MSIKTVHPSANNFYFCTFTCDRWINLFSNTDSYDLVYNWFGILENLMYKITGYVIMPNHLHFIVYCPEEKKNLNTRISNGKRFIAYEIIQRLKQKAENKILFTLNTDVKASDRKQGKIHQVFIDSFDAREIPTLERMNQKLDYIHFNPIAKKWKLVDSYVDYPHSSARYYETGVHGIYEVTDFRELWVNI